MTSAPTNPNPALSGSLVGYDPTGHQIGIAFQVGTVVQDATTGIWYAPLAISGSISATNPSVGATGSGTPASATLVGFGSGGNLTGVDATHGLPVNIVAGSSAGTQYTDGGTPPTNPIGGAIVYDNSGAWVDVGVDHPLPVQGTFWQTTQPVSAASLPLPTGAAQETGGNLATIVTDLTPFVTAGGGGYIRQDSTATIAKESGGNLATLAGIVSSSKAAVKAAAGDIADLAHGQGAMSASVPVAIASDQSAVPVKRSAVAAYTLASTTTSGATQNSGDITVGPYTEISLDINTTAQAGTNPTIQYFYERKGADGIYYVLWQSAVLTAATNTLSTSIGAGMAYNQSLGSTGRLRWVVGGSATPTFTHTANITGK